MTLIPGQELLKTDDALRINKGEFTIMGTIKKSMKERDNGEILEMNQWQTNL